MRRMLILMPILAMAACKEEPSFDERYQETSKQIGEKAEELDGELEKASDPDRAEKEPGLKD